MRIPKNENVENYKNMQKLALSEFIAEFPNLVLTFIGALAANTVIVWVDCINSFGRTLHTFIVFILAGKMKKETGEKYNFGLERLEVFVSFICDVLVIACMLTIFSGAVYCIIEPQKPSNSLLGVMILKASNITFDVIFLVNQVKICKEHSSSINDSELANCIRELSFDVIVAVVICISYFFRSEAWVCYLNPIVSIILLIYFFVVFSKRIAVSIGQLSDVSLPIKEQDEIYDIVLNYPKTVKRIDAVNCRKLNKKIYIDVCIKMKDGVTYGDQQEYLTLLERDIKVKYPESEIRLVITRDE